MRLREFVERYGEPFSSTLGIDLRSHNNGEIVRWFLASMLYSRPIRESTATLTYQTFEQEGVVTPSRILKTGWEGLVSLLDEGGYARYDFSTAEKLLRVFGALQKDYKGDLNRLHEMSSDGRDLETRLMDLGKGIGPTTVSIFLREMRGIWSKADPEPTQLVRMGMRELGISDIKKLAEQQDLDAVRLETALLRLGKDFVKRGKRLQVEID